MSANGWRFPGEDEFRAEERRRGRWWAENFPPERGAASPRCRHCWPGVCRRLGQGYGSHECARPVNHHQGRYRICMCYCGERAPELKPVSPGRAVPAGEQEPLWGGAA